MSKWRLDMTQLILASTSPRRKEILEKVNIPFKVMQPDVDESVFNGNDPESIVIELAKNKAMSVLKNIGYNDIVLGVDTIVYVENMILGKPFDKNQARQMMQVLSNKTHLVISGVSLLSRNGFEKTFAVKTQVEFLLIDENEINEYVNSDEPYDKAGGYAIQGLAAKFIKSINGCYYNVMGLPLSAVYSVIKNMI
jgi:septum formation protein